MAMDWHDTLMGSVLMISGGLTFAYTRAASKILLILTLIGVVSTIVIGVLLSFILPEALHPRTVHQAKRLVRRSTSSAGHGMG